MVSVVDRRVERDALIEKLLRLGLSNPEVARAFYAELKYTVYPFDISKVRVKHNLPTCKAGPRGNLRPLRIKLAKPPKPAAAVVAVSPEPFQGPLAPTQALLADLLLGMRRLGLRKVTMEADGSYLLAGKLGGDG